MSLVNATWYTAVAVPIYDARGQRVVLVLIKATFELDRKGDLVPARDPAPLRMADELWDPKASQSSVRYPTDVLVKKARGDVVVVGSAICDKPVASADVVVKVGHVEAPLTVHGERHFERGARGVVIGPAIRFTEQPIVYEYAYGGTAPDFHLADERNPVGVGVAHRHEDLLGTRAPQIEHPARPHTTASDAHPPMGYGATLPHWLPRRHFVGTLDEAWQKDRMPLLPADYDDRFENVAHPSLQIEAPLVPETRISVLGMSEDRLFQCVLPDLRLLVHGLRGRERETLSPPIDTLLIEPAAGRIEVSTRAVFTMGRGARALREVRVDFHG
jgi:hypothetical protein